MRNRAMVRISSDAARRLLAEQLRPQTRMRVALEHGEESGSASINVQTALRAIDAAIAERSFGVTEADLPY